MSKTDKQREEKKRPSWYWHIIYAVKKRAMILDPDGWDRKNYDKSWGEPITYDEFKERAMLSTHDYATQDRFIYILDQALAQNEAEVLERVGKDTERLDFLDRQNQILNEFHKTEYGWELIINNNVNRLMAGNVNRVDLNDSKAHGVKSCREAIDEKMNQLKTK